MLHLALVVVMTANSYIDHQAWNSWSQNITVEQKCICFTDWEKVLFSKETNLVKSAADTCLVPHPNNVQYKASNLWLPAESFRRSPPSCQSMKYVLQYLQIECSHCYSISNLRSFELGIEFSIIVPWQHMCLCAIASQRWLFGSVGRSSNSKEDKTADLGSFQPWCILMRWDLLFKLTCEVYLDKSLWNVKEILIRLRDKGVMFLRWWSHGWMCQSVLL